MSCHSANGANVVDIYILLIINRKSNNNHLCKCEKKKKTMCVVDNIVHDPKKVINNTHAHKVQPGVLFLIVRA